VKSVKSVVKKMAKTAIQPKLARRARLVQYAVERVTPNSKQK